MAVASARDQASSTLRDFQRVALALSAEQDLDQLLELIVRKCREVTSADGGSLYLIEPDPPKPGGGNDRRERSLRFAVAQNVSKRVEFRTTSLPLDHASIAGHVALTRTALNVPDAYALPPDAQFSFNPRMDQASEYRTVSMLVVPMIDHADEVVGVLQMINKKRSPDVRLHTPEVALKQVQPFTGPDEEMVTALASLAAVGIQGRRAARARMALEEELRQSQKMDAVGRLAGGVAHDFNNLLMVIGGRTDLLMYHVDAGNPLRRHIELVKQTTDRAVALTRQLLAFSRKEVLQPSAVDLNAVVAGMAAMLRRLIGEHIDLVVVPNANPGCVHGDPGQLEQVIMNLVVNARDAMPEGGRLTLETSDVTLDEAFVRAHMGSRPGAYVLLAVTDMGVGMDAETKAHLFEPFFTTKAPGQGTGLGLATVYGIVKQHLGYVAVESELDRGTRVAIYLPRPTDTIEPAPASPPSVKLAAGSETVLLAEDEESVRDLVCEMLRTSGYVVLEARHGAEALLVADQHPGSIDLLLTDVVMPQMGGPELARRLKPLHPRMRVLYMSGYPAAATLQAQLLPKPFTREQLAAKLREVLDRPLGS